MKQSLMILLLVLPFITAAQNVGIGTANPAARLHVADSAVVFSAAGTVPQVAGKAAIEGEGRRMMWHPGKAAFRVGYVSTNGWDDVNIGRFSFAAGKDVIAQGTGSIATGLENNEAGYGSIAIGVNCLSAYDYSISIGKAANSIGISADAIGNEAYSGSSNGFALGNLATVTQPAFNGFAIGNSVTVSAPYATAIGNNSTASGLYSVAIGQQLTASGANSTALGFKCIASGTYAFASRFNSTASGFLSYANGYIAQATGKYSVALGNAVVASGSNSTAMGNYVSTSNLDGSFAIGDNSTTTEMQSFAANGFRARFAGGYRLFTTSAVTIGAFLNSGANSWAALSDVRMKENFLPVDGEVFLKRIADMPLTTWNYIGQESKTMRHYGPMAQDFYAAFGNDAMGEIGCDTLINQQDFLGVNLIAIQALEKRTEKISELEKKMEQQERQMEKLEKENALLKEEMKALLAAIKAKGIGN